MSQEHKDLLAKVDKMNATIGVAKQARIRAVINEAYRRGCLDKININKLAEMPVKQIHLVKKNL